MSRTYFESRMSRAALALFVAFLSSRVSVAQSEQGAITGVILDETGAVVPKAKVNATNTSTQTVATTESNDAGNYKIPYLLPGPYTIVAEKAGFSQARVANISLPVGLTATINVTLRTGTVQTSVTVEANSELLDLQSSQLGYNVSTQQVLQLPLNRNAYNAIGLAPGVMGNSSAGTGTGAIISGGRASTSAVLFDGQETRNNSTGGNSYTPPMEAVGELKVLTSNFSAEYGRSSGGVITAAGRTGTNDLHGSAYEFLRNTSFNANGWTNNRNGLKINPVHHNEFGFALSGPVYVPRIYNGHNKTFFFFNWEHQIDHSPSNYTGTVPTAQQRTGDFSQTVTNTGALIRIFDPATTAADPASPGNYTRTAFPGNRIPANRINPVTANLLNYYPLPTLPGISSNYAQAVTRVDNWNKYFGRVDQNFGEKNRLFVRYGGQFEPVIYPAINVAWPDYGTNGGPGGFTQDEYSWVVSDTQTFTPNIVGEFRAGYTRSIRNQNPGSFDFTTLGLPQYLKAASLNQLFPEIDVTDFTGLGPQRASLNIDAENTPEGQAHVTVIHGDHSVKAGFDYLFAIFNTLRPDYPSGDFSFSRAYTQGPNPAVASTTSGYGLATLLLGAPTGGQFTQGPALSASQKSYNWYLQDDWKVTRTLTLNLGLRWEYQTPWTERYNHLAYFDANAIDPITGRKGVLSFVNNSNRYPSDPQKSNFAPRAGLAYNFAKNTVFRAGYGWFYAPSSGGIGGSPGDLGSGAEASTSVFLGQPPAAPNTPPAGASFANPFVTGLISYPNTLIGSGIGAIFRDWKTPMNQMWNAGFERTVGKNLLLEVAYIGTRGEHLWANSNGDAVDPSYASLGSQLNSLVPNPFYGQIANGSLSSRTVRLSSLLSPYPQYTGINRIRGSIGDSIYHAVTVRAERHMSAGLLFQVSYTKGKLIDNTPERFTAQTGSSIINPYNLRMSRSISDNDISQRFVANFIYQLPFGHGKRWLSQGLASYILGNWEVSGIYTMQTGTPIVIQPACNTQLPGIGCYAIRSHDPNLPSGQQSINRWFDTTAFGSTPLYSLGTDSRTEPNLRNPGLINLDALLSRSQPIGERTQIQFRAELYNATNHTNLNPPQTLITAANFGQITQAAAGRSMQLALRLSF
jgi:hypothetical protein